jgi:hypothetical protein
MSMQLNARGKVGILLRRELLRRPTRLFMAREVQIPCRIKHLTCQKSHTPRCDNPSTRKEALCSIIAVRTVRERHSAPAHVALSCKHGGPDSGASVIPASYDACTSA